MSAKKHTCVLCSTQVRKATGEHALPEQVLKLLGDANDRSLGKDAYDMHALTYRGTKGQEAKKLDNALSAIRVPCCVDCNQWLNETYEKPAAEHLPKLIEGQALFTSNQDELAPLSRWIIKTVLMCNHPRVHYSGMTWKAKADFPYSEHVPNLLNDLRKLRELPHHLSLWATFAINGELATLLPGPDATIKMGVNIRRPDGLLQLTVTDSSDVSVMHVDGRLPPVRKLWPVCAGCTSCS
ncbi:hypothetical protein [Streptomyces sp. NBC_01264]|uniref:hypothetical protein n=1 Tax=Streptomyces sp. NBC_01264 TaxID=2903804 RepID=UPI002258F6BE|nr:hypothetical protein [Streptomyces sp. NBC_01264]MCX4783348.1 hypothetical protein [Streptomyces sp. NBC_01264]